MQFPLRHAAVGTVVAGMRNPDQVNSAIERSSKTIPSALWADLQNKGLIPDDR